MATIIYDKRLWKKCIKCRNWKPRKDLELDDGQTKKKGFGAHNSSDGLQSICFACKNVANTKSRERNVTARIRHHTATRCLTQLGELAPAEFTTDLEKHLGYRIKLLVKHLAADLKDREGPTRKLRDALNEGYHIDHIRPLSSFNVFMSAEMAANLGKGLVEGDIDWLAFRDCWDITNLSAIPSAENLAKGATYQENDDAKSPRKESPAIEEVQAEEVTIAREVDSEVVLDPGIMSGVEIPDCDCVQGAEESCVDILCPRKMV